MATSSILGGSRLPESIGGKDIDALGPSDNSDSGSDAAGAYGEDSDTDAAGTGNRASVEGPGMHTDTDILPDHLVDSEGYEIEGSAADGLDPSFERMGVSERSNVESVEDLAEDTNTNTNTNTNNDNDTEEPDSQN